MMDISAHSERASFPLRPPSSILSKMQVRCDRPGPTILNQLSKEHPLQSSGLPIKMGEKCGVISREIPGQFTTGTAQSAIVNPHVSTTVGTDR